MLEIYNYLKTLTGFLSDYTDLCVEKKLIMDEKTLSFTTSIAKVKEFTIQVEGYVRYDSVEYVIREINIDTSGKASIVAQMNIEELEAHVFRLFYQRNKTVYDVVSEAISGVDTGWTVEPYTDGRTKIVKLEHCNSYDVLKEIAGIFHVNFKFDTINKKITIAGLFGTDYGAFVSDELNLKNISVEMSSYDTYTELEAYGKDDLTFESINDGKKYVADYSYFGGSSQQKKKKRYVWEASDYENPLTLLEDAKAKLADMCKPYISYSIDVYDIAKINPNYLTIGFNVGDIVTIIDSTTGIFDKQICVECKIYPDDPQKNTYVFANKTQAFTDLLQKNSVTGKVTGTSTYNTSNGNTAMFSSSENSGGSGGGDIIFG